MTGQKVTFFVSKNKYLMTIISLIDHKRFRFKMLDCEGRSKDHPEIVNFQ
jgi:hypothetical protein